MAGNDFLAPPIWLLVCTAVAVIALTSLALFVLFKTNKNFRGFAAKATLLAIGYNALLAVVKFVWSPIAVYEANRRMFFETTEFGLTWDTVVAGVVVFGLYYAALRIIYRLQKKKPVALERRLLDLQSSSEETVMSKWEVRGYVGVALLAFVTLLTGGAVLWVAYAAAYFTVGGAGLYLFYLFQAPVALLIVITLVGATLLASLTFKTVSEQARAVGNAALLSSFFGVAVILVAAYHALWVIFLLVLNSVWPLRTVTPK